MRFVAEPGVGVVGMCFTGGFALAMATTPSVIAPVMSQPSLPFPVTEGRKHAIDCSAGELEHIANRCSKEGMRVLGLRFKNDPIVPAERFALLRERLGDGFVAIEIDQKDGHPKGPLRQHHSVLTVDLIDEPGEPTLAALNQVLDLMRAQAALALNPQPTRVAPILRGAHTLHRSGMMSKWTSTGRRGGRLRWRPSLRRERMGIARTGCTLLLSSSLLIACAVEPSEYDDAERELGDHAASAEPVQRNRPGESLHRRHPGLRAVRGHENSAIFSNNGIDTEHDADGQRLGAHAVQRRLSVHRARAPLPAVQVGRRLAAARQCRRVVRHACRRPTAAWCRPRRPCTAT